MKVNPAQWSEIKVRYCSGETAKQLSEEFGIATQTIKQRCYDEQWPTPANLRKQAEALLTQADNLDGSNQKEIIKKDWRNRAEKHRQTMYENLEKKLSDPETWNRLQIKSAHDLEKVDAVMRRTLELEESFKSENSNSKTQTSVNFNIFQTISDTNTDNINTDNSNNTKTIDITDNE